MKIYIYTDNGLIPDQNGALIYILAPHHKELFFAINLHKAPRNLSN